MDFSDMSEKELEEELRFCKEVVRELNNNYWSLVEEYNKKLELARSYYEREEISDSFSKKLGMSYGDYMRRLRKDIAYYERRAILLENAIN